GIPARLNRPLDVGMAQAGVLGRLGESLAGLLAPQELGPVAGAAEGLGGGVERRIASRGAASGCGGGLGGGRLGGGIQGPLAGRRDPPGVGGGAVPLPCWEAA